MLSQKECKLLHLHPQESVIRQLKTGALLQNCCACTATGNDRPQFLDWYVETSTARARWNRRYLCDRHGQEVASAFGFRLKKGIVRCTDRTSLAVEALRIAGGTATILELQRKTEGLEAYENFCFRKAIDQAKKYGCVVKVAMQGSRPVWGIDEAAVSAREAEAIADAS
jgi:hypothetical protein